MNTAWRGAENLGGVLGLEGVLLLPLESLCCLMMEISKVRGDGGGVVRIT